MTLVGIAVTDVERFEMKACIHTADIRMVVDADHDLAFAATHEVGHPLVVLERKVHAVPGGLPVRRVHIVESVSAVITLRAFKPREIFNVGAGQALPGGREVLLDPQQVDGRSSRRSTERLPGDLAGESMVLQVEESGGALNVGEGFGAGHFLPFEHLARAERPFELAHELFEVVLHDAVKRDQVAVDVVEDFDRRWLGLHEVERGTAGKDFNVAFVWWKKRDEAISQATFAAHPRDDGCGHRKQDLYCMDKQVLGSPRFVHGVRALAGLAGNICRDGGRVGC
ncbi:hypothetical protein EMIT0P171_190078 [Pseudomonas sp. IT-P171]